MCSAPTVKSPTPQQPKEKPPVYMRNRYLDGLGIGAESGGRNSLRIDMARRPSGAGVPPGLAIGAPGASTRATLGIMS